MSLLSTQKAEVEVLFENDSDWTCRVWIDYDEFTRKEYILDFPKEHCMLCTLAENGRTILSIPSWLSVAKMNEVGVNSLSAKFVI